MSTHGRAQVLYYLAENLSARADEFAHQLVRRAGYEASAAGREVEASIDRLFSYAAWADKFDGAVHTPPLRGVALAMHEALGVVGIACPNEAPLLAFVSLIAPALAMGNRVVALASEASPLAATDFYQVVETSDVPAGALNILTGERAALLPALAKHDDVDALWCFGTAGDSALVERESVGNLKRTFVDHGRQIDWFDPGSAGLPFLRHAVQVKNIWIPYGD
jgi:aldehyde dehydrogenase (NAD+)